MSNFLRAVKPLAGGPHLLRYFSSSSIMSFTKEVVQPGDGKNFPKPGDNVTMHYHGTLPGGKVFDSSVNRGKPFKCRIGKGELIRGWDEGVPQMSVGEKAKLTCPPEYAYGANGIPGVIPPQATLIFDVELISID